jgi:hypothetical protein
MSRPFAALTMLACAGALAGPATASVPDPAADPAGEPQLWATVNVCDTPTAPDSMGVRAGMPGNGTAQRMYMRFSAEHWSRTRQAWVPVPGTGTSPWVFAGSAEPVRRQAGWTFRFSTPPAGATFTMRAVVQFEWREGEKQVARRVARRATRTGRRAKQPRVLRRATRTTETGIPGVERGDPPGTSKALCLIA